MDKVKDIKQSVILNAPIEKVWKTVSSAEGLETWFMPNDMKAIPGHEFHVQSPFGPSPCKVLEVEEPHFLSFSWDTDGWIVSFYLEETDGKTAFTLVHSGWKEPDAILPKPNEKSDVIRERMNNGWQNIVSNRLREVVEK
ncbi:SRPBCC family protein [Virgibacillus senegalensis]|uniref:SRPBCC family protein n=1 Tax=Virgibacillus senegalensis TaxID=1499679 RepID=UPI00069EC845|nr:SRPBCC domain-containing protein [Virgibacillus senegalensis]